jgi:hypothetical protein
MNCEESKNLITISVFGELTSEENAQLEDHLRECSGCANIYERLGKLNIPARENEDIPLPDKEKSWRVISTKAIKRRDGWFPSFVPKKPAFQFSLVLLLLAVGFAGGYFIRSGRQEGRELVQLRQEVLQIREMAAASLVRQESLNARLSEAGTGSLYLLLEDPAIRQNFIRSLSEETSPLVEVALILARHINQLRVH